jgi:hypothetical protein
MNMTDLQSKNNITLQDKLDEINKISSFTDTEKEELKEVLKELDDKQREESIKKELEFPYNEESDEVLETPELEKEDFRIDFGLTEEEKNNLKI